MKRIILVLLILLLPSLLFAENFFIDGYDIKVDVNEDGSARINEELIVVFTTPSHGIYRDIQDRFDNPNNTWKDINAKISNIECNLPFTIERSSEFTSLKIGSASSSMEGPVKIAIAYDYDLGGDIYEDYDEFYYNFISAAWDTVIRNINVEITFPKPIDSSMAHITYGQYGSERKLNFDTTDNGRTLKASLRGINPYEAVTIRAEMEDGYFSNQNVLSKGKNTLLLTLTLAIFIIFTIYAFLSYKRYGVDEELTPPINFYPPKHYNPMDVGYVYDNSLTLEKEITAMFYYWADKGYIKLREENKDITLIKVKEIPAEECEAERMLFVMVFQKGDEVSFEDLVSDDFYLNVPEKVFPKVKNQFTGKCALKSEESAKKKRFNTTLLVIVAIASQFIASIPGIGILSVFLIIPTLILLSVSFATFSSMMKKWDIAKVHAKAAAFMPIIFVGLFITIFLTPLYSTIVAPLMALTAAIIVVLSIISSALLITITDKRSEYGQKKLEEILGYKDFIERVEIDKLKELIDEDPEIFYHTLSFAIVFGLEKKWAKKFESLYIPRCSWYYSPSGAVFDAMFYSSLIDRSRHQIRQFNSLNIQNSMPKSGGGGSSSFSGSSGFAGGGFSGGGGRSW